MYRLIFIICLLISVLSIGFPISNPLSDFVFIPLRILGIDVSMTPITTDMSMMSDANNVPLYKTNLGLTIILKNGTVRDISPRELDLYDHKIPIILYYEILGYGGDMPEGRAYLCKSFTALTENMVSGFFLWTKSEHARYGLNEIQECHF